MAITVLVVEDSPADQRVARRYLETLNYAISGLATTAAEALAAVQSRRPDVALVNAQLGGGTGGLKIAEEIRERHDVPVVLTSMPGAWTAVDRARSVGAQAHLVKPFIQAQLATAIEMAYARHRMERALEHQRQWFQDVLSGLSDGVIACDFEGRITFINRAAATVLGVDPARAREHPIGDIFRSLQDPTGPPFEDPVTIALRTGSAVPDRVGRIQVAGVVRLVETSASVLDDAEFGPSGAVMVVRDVSQRERDAEALRLASKIEAIGALAAGVAHHFNNDLQIVLGHAELITSLTPAGSQPQASAREILRAGESTTKLVEQLLSFSNSGRDAPERIPLARLVADLADLIRTVVPTSVAVELPTALPSCELNVRVRDLQSAVLHLVDYALSAMPRGGTLNFAVERRPTGAVALSIRDSSTGLSADSQQHLFDQYSSDDRRGGLGLAAVQHTAELHGGTVEVSSSPDRGTTLSIVLPGAESATPLPMITRPPEVAIAAGHTILLVEDEEMVRTLLEHALQGLGYGVISADSGARALEVLSAGRPRISAVLTDVIMPAMDGVSLSRRIAERSPDLPIIYMSATSQSGLESYFKDAPGKRLHIQKPFKIEELAAQLRAALPVRSNRA